MTNKEQIKTVLEEMGYRPWLDEDGDLIVRYQLKAFYFLANEEEDNYVAVVFPQLYEMEDGEETLVMATCNKLVREIKFAKVYVDQTFKSVSASCEFFFTDEASLKKNIEHAFHVLGMARTLFRKAKEELAE